MPSILSLVNESLYRSPGLLCLDICQISSFSPPTPCMWQTQFISCSTSFSWWPGRLCSVTTGQNHHIAPGAGCLLGESQFIFVLFPCSLPMGHRIYTGSLEELCLLEHSCFLPVPHSWMSGFSGVGQLGVPVPRKMGSRNLSR